jgi:hypothetical protein
MFFLAPTEWSKSYISCQLHSDTTLMSASFRYHSHVSFIHIPLSCQLHSDTILMSASFRYHSHVSFIQIPLWCQLHSDTTLMSASFRYHSDVSFIHIALWCQLHSYTTLMSASFIYHCDVSFIQIPLSCRYHCPVDIGYSVLVFISCDFMPNLSLFCMPRHGFPIRFRFCFQISTVDNHVILT